METPITRAAADAAYEIVIHACSRCQYEQPTRSCDWDSDAVGFGNSFATIEEAEAAIPVLAATGDTDTSQYRVREIGDRYPL